MTHDTVVRTGAIVWWTIHETNDLADIKSKLAAASLERYNPFEATPLAALKSAAMVVYPNHLIRPLAQNAGWAVVEETRGASSNAYQQVDALVINGSTVQTYGSKHQQVVDEYQRQRGISPPHLIANQLIKAVNELGGYQLRDTGGIYFVPATGMDTWIALSDAFGSAAKVYRAITGDDAASIEAILDALETHVLSAVKSVQDDIASGDFGKVAMGNRSKQMVALRDKVAAVEALCGSAIPGLKEKIAVVETQAATLALAEVALSGVTTCPQVA